MPVPQKKPKRVPLVLVVENDDDRVKWFEERMKGGLLGVRMLHCSTGGTALNVIDQDPSDRFVGILLDHDLDRPGMPNAINGKKVAERIIQRWSDSPDIPIFVHSANTSGGPAMRDALEGSGFTEVSRAMFHNIDTETFAAWMTKVAAYRDEFFDPEADDE